MKSVDIALRGIERAGRWLRGAERAMEDGRWDDVVYCSQMAAEQSAKAVLFALGIDFPKEHDVSGVLAELMKKEEIPLWFREKIPRLSSIVSELAKMRGQAGYGFEEGLTVDNFRDYAPEALEMAREVNSACRKLLDEIL